MNEYALVAFGYVMLMFAGLISQDGKSKGLLSVGRSLALLLLLFIFTLNLFTNMKIVTRKVCLACKAKCAKKRRQNLKEATSVESKAIEDLKK